MYASTTSSSVTETTTGSVEEQAANTDRDERDEQERGARWSADPPGAGASRQVGHRSSIGSEWVVVERGWTYAA